MLTWSSSFSFDMGTARETTNCSYKFAFTVNHPLNNQTMLLTMPKEINSIFFRYITEHALTNNIGHDTNSLLINELSEVATSQF